jgi:hypothetical protein
MKHSKVKNTAILFELLVRKIASDVLDGKSDSFAVNLIREHFHPKVELGKELQLYRTFFNTPTLSEGKAFNLLDLVVARRKTLNERLLATQKYNLIKEIKKHCDLKEFMAGRVPSYKVYASIYKLFEATSDDVFLLDSVVKSRFLVVEHLQGKNPEEQIVKETAFAETLRNQDEDIRFLSYKFLLERFNNKYSELNSSQKNLLREYINKGTDVTPFKKYVTAEATAVSNLLQTRLHRIPDEVTRIKLHEVVMQLKHIAERPTIKENHMTALMIAYQLVDETTALL